MINPKLLDIAKLPSVPLLERSSLPDKPCIYFAIDAASTVQYIGKSVNTRARWVAHEKLSTLTNLQGMRISYLEISEPALLIHVESALIEWFKPPLNQTLKLNPYSKGMKGLRVRANKTIAGIATELKVSASTVQNWEQLTTMPRMTACGFKRLMNTYGCTFDELVQAETEAKERLND